MKDIPLALTFDDVLLVPQYSNILPRAVSLKAKLTRNISLNIPIVSAAMDTVTEERMAIAMALHGGIGVIHKNCEPDEQAAMVARVKRYENGFIREPMVLSPNNLIADAVEIREEQGFKAIPITEDGTLGSKVVGLLTRNDYLGHKHAEKQVGERMRAVVNLLTAKAPITLSEANDVLEESKHSKLLILNEDGTLHALMTRRDIEKNEDYPNAAKDSQKRLLVAAAVGPAHNMEERVEKLSKAGVDVLIVDTAHGHSQGVLDTVTYVKKNYPKIEVIGGNIATPEAAEALVNAGADAVKVGIGPGSICTTRIIAGIGVPQLSAIMNTAAKARELGVPVIADGGIKYSGDMAKALAGGASTVMVGSILAGTEESPGEIIYSEGQTYKYYRGMGSIAAMKKGGKERYAQSNVADDKLVPEGIEGKILLKGKLSGEIFQMCGGIRSSMGYTGAKDIEEFQAKSQMVQITGAGLRESHPHDVGILKDAPNYRG